MTRSRAPAGAVRAVPAGPAPALRGALVALPLSGLVVGLVAHALGQAVAATPACSLASSADGQGAAAAVRVAIDGRPAAILSFTDPLRCDGADTLAALRTCGIARIVLATGDRRAVAQALTAGLPIDAVAADLDPADKTRIVREERRPGPVMMVGDGINDAPALAGAALGARGAAAGGDPHRAAGPRHRAPERARRARALARRNGRCGLRRAHAGAGRPAAGGRRRRRDPERDAGSFGPGARSRTRPGRAGADRRPERPPARRAGIREPRGGRCRVAGRRAGQCARNSGTGASIRSERVTPPKTNSRTRECR